MPARLDHLVIAVPDLDRAAPAWTDAGLPAVRGGAHPVGTVNALVRGPEPAYVELIAAGSEESNPWLDRVRPEHGPISWAVAVDDVDEARAALVAAGFDPQPVRDGSRTAPDGEVVAWRTCDVGPGPYDGSLPFLIQWTTPMPPGPADGPVVEWMSITPPEPDLVADLLLALGFEPQRHWPRRVFREAEGRVGVTLRPVGEAEDADWSMSWEEPEDDPRVRLTFGLPAGELVRLTLDGTGVATHADRRQFVGASLVPTVEEACARLRRDADDLLAVRAAAWVEAVTSTGVGSAVERDPGDLRWADPPHVGIDHAVVLRGGEGTQPVTVVWGRAGEAGPRLLVGVGDPVEVVERRPVGTLSTLVEDLDAIDDAFVLALSGGVYAVRDGERRAVVRSLHGHGSSNLPGGEGARWLAEADAGRRTDGVLRGEPWL